MGFLTGKRLLITGVTGQVAEQQCEQADAAVRVDENLAAARGEGLPGVLECELDDFPVHLEE